MTPRHYLPAGDVRTACGLSPWRSDRIRLSGMNVADSSTAFWPHVTCKTCLRRCPPRAWAAPGRTFSSRFRSGRGLTILELVPVTETREPMALCDCWTAGYPTETHRQRRVPLRTLLTHYRSYAYPPYAAILSAREPKP